MESRPYQIESLALLRAAFAAKRRGAILQLPTGSGKTKVFCDILKAIHERGRNGIMVVRGTSLVSQASARLTREGVPHGIYQGSNTAGKTSGIHVCSIDTLFARRVVPPADIVIVDEAHLSFGGGYEWFFEQYDTVFKIGVTATPFSRRGFRHLADVIVRPIGFRELVAQGYLVAPRYFVPYVPDLTGVKTSNGDYNGRELSDRSRADKDLTANCARVWLQRVKGQSCIVFACSVAHAGELSRALVEAGARCATVTAASKDGERASLIASLQAGELDVLLSVGVLTTGVDIPSLRAIICTRPTKSYNLWIQMLGRGTRPAPGKTHFEVYDLAGNLYEHGPIEADPLGDLDGMPEVTRVAIRTCLACYACFESGPSVCPSCGASLVETRERKTGKRVHGLADNDEVVEKVVEPWELLLPDMIAYARKNGHRKGYIYHTLKRRFGDEIADRAWPKIRAAKRWPVKARGNTPASSAKF